MGTKDRYFEKHKYEPATGTFATALVFTFVGILSLIFRALRVNFIGLSEWGFWLFIPAFFIFIGAFSQLYSNSRHKKMVMSALMDRNMQGTYKLESIGDEIGIDPKNILRVLMDLRNQGKVRYQFNSNTGEIILGENIVYKPVNEYATIEKKEVPSTPPESKTYCVYCGQSLPEGAKFCEHCGSKV